MTSNQSVSTPEASPAHNFSAGSSSQFAVLNYLFPGISYLLSAVDGSHGPNTSGYASILVAISAMFIAWGYMRHSISSIVHDHFMSSVRIRTDDEIYIMFILWLSKQEFSTKSRHFLANADVSARSRLKFRFDDEGDEAGACGQGKKTLQYTPAFGSHIFWYKTRMLFLARHQNLQ